MSARPPTRLPSSRFEEEPLLVVGGLSMSARQLGWIGMSILAWMFVGKYVGSFLGLGTVVSFALCSPLIIAGPVFAWGRVQGRPLEMWMADRLLFYIEKREYTLGDDSRRTRVYQTRWEDDDDGK